MNKVFLRIFITIIFSFVIFQIAYTQDWTWKNGSKNIDMNGVYGTVTIASTANYPGARESSTSWTDNSGDLWLFGGDGYPASGGKTLLNDLWKYNIASNSWAWMKGGNFLSLLGVYGTLGVSSPTNYPGSREGSVSFKDASGNLWLFGGYGFSSISGGSYLNDLWKYNITTNEWVWINGSNQSNVTGVYGTQGVSSPTNYPGGRTDAVGWVDLSGNFWLFGGSGISSIPGATMLCDLWKYNVTTNEWTWMKGSNLQPPLNGIYGTQGVAAPSNNPGSRENSAAGIDLSGHLLLFGGLGLSATNPGTSSLNDLWKYNITTNQWTWLKGSNNIQQLGNYGTQNVYSPSNYPGGRSNVFGWNDNLGNFFIFGGLGYCSSPSGGLLNDLWKYNPATNQWVWLKGSDINTSLNGVYGTLNVSAPNNNPGSREYSAAWTDLSGNIWLHGGHGFPATGLTAWLNDLWVFSNVSSTNITENDLSSIPVIYPNPSDGRIKISLHESYSTLKIFNSLGEIIYSIKSPEKDIDVDLYGIKPGMYFVTVENETERFIKKIVVLK